MAIERFHATVSQEGDDGPVRGKIPAGLVRALKANPGDMIEFQTQGKTLVGGGVLKGRDADRIRNSRAATPAPKSTSRPKAKAKAAPAKKVVQKAGKAAAPRPKAKTAAPKPKASKRKTRVTYEAPAPPRKKKLSFKRNR